MPAAAPSTDPVTEQAIAWLLRLRDEQLSDAEIESFADWLSRDPAHADAFTRAEALFKDMVAAADTLPRPRQAVTAKPAPPSIGRLASTRTTGRPTRRRRQAFGIAAACALLAAMVLPQRADWFSDYHTQTGEIKEVQLSDGSRLLLNTDSALSVDFKADRRQILLHRGQVRFSVAADTRRPFQVVADGLTIRALGTVFEVYKKAPGLTRVVVEEHAVAVTSTDGNTAGARVTVGAGQLLDYRAGQALPQASSAAMQPAMAWQQRRLLINDRPLAELIAELERYRPGRIFLGSETLKGLRVTGVFSLDRPDDALTAVGNALGLQTTEIGPWWVVLHR